ncbi:nucleoside triphosphate pyrophosphohydrolase family protein [Paracoccus fistulariae]|uniref:Nucleoside triphosphate pyrophosphohydrolase family protein n=1 Tax=Paracoccus fistulariae TaxID=658446 RepID=A0ABY7SND5_9RHOB|nr:nucleoside triphosphate pyrophosphohydrolase family protein [Paracoccus fistulariae]MDB6180253.1 nucleoside triphosphate pyrophosphohydrolase family protein [Paracoccus fistulariae]WCR08336.1 nucleoside triphosphate pyrophosphohydrolase family protein [Paracoccus fistulariae]
MADTLAIVQEWHEAFDVPVEESPVIPEARVQMRLALLEEEVAELRAAAQAGDLVEVLDALCDIQYVLDGTFLEFGLHKLKDRAMAEVHDSNMSKLGADGRPVLREDGKVLKGPSFRRPDLARILAERDQGQKNSPF